MHDNLTGIPNRSYLESFLSYKIAEHNRFDRKFALLFADIDHFRDFNNKYGHDVGDLVLKSVAKGIQHTVKKNDLFGRWGGEEFVGIFSINRSYEASIIAERIRFLVENTVITTCQNEQLKVTVSVGITVSKKSDKQDEIIKRADELMYKSKENGRNRVSTDITNEMTW